MLKMFDYLLEAKGFGWALVRFALLVAPAIIALVILSMFFRLD